MSNLILRGNIVDVFTRDIYKGEIVVCDGIIQEIRKTDTAPDCFILPGLIDSHVHIESSMLTPSRFAELAVSRGTVGVVTDPHEIANVAGEKGVEFMIEDGNKVPLKFFFGAPSCVPATSFETSGANLNSEVVSRLLSRKDIWFLSEMMNFPGVVYDDVEVHAKLNAAKAAKKPVDGHAPGLTGESLKKYVASGISTDHECAFPAEALEKLKLGVKIQIREGSAARNFSSLYPLFEKHADSIMLCTDDSHPDELIQKGHIDKLIRLGLEKGVDFFDLIRSATVVPAEHYGLPVGLLREGDFADLIVVDNLSDFNVQNTYIDGVLVYSLANGINFNLPDVSPVNVFNCNAISPDDVKVYLPNNTQHIRVIEVMDGELLTNEFKWNPTLISGEEVVSDLSSDILKLVVVNRYHPQKPIVGFVKNMGLKRGALGSTVAHDSHNIIVAGVDDESIVRIVNALIENAGGIAASDGSYTEILPLPVGGLMSIERGEVVAKKYETLDQMAHTLGSTLRAPFMTLSFLSLLVIPSLKLGDKGLFDVNKFDFVPLFEKA
ncbi:adenine deaminase [Alkaliflexus imshenetskii]|uniref:adenine deaminase n=1 Tax=Alkaliflexus imshenetskii TaxID=286730 RepID=UPI00047C85C3|nr:adenine deaminase [Alkaliflexus imshenetskii]